MKVVPVILSGGSGTRLWPKSRADMPKQFQQMIGTGSMFQQTIDRVSSISDSVMVVCNESHRFVVAEQLQQTSIAQSRIILEPIARNTAPAITLAALIALREDPDAVLLVLPSDHLIDDQRSFIDAVEQAAGLATDGKLVTFGVVPQHPETGYGYLLVGDQQGKGSCSKVVEFVEKPDVETAEEYVNSGCYQWNSGMFVFEAKSILAEMEQFNPALFEACSLAIEFGDVDQDFIRPDEHHFSKSENVSVDNAVMEHTSNAWSVSLDAGWSDLGGWASVWQESQKDADGNVIIGDVLSVGTTDCYAESTTRLIATLGVKDLVIVDSADCLLIADRAYAQNVRQVVQELADGGRTEHLQHRKVARPWGDYESIDRGARHQVKHIRVAPKASLSKQMHHHRAEHWIVVSGTAEVEIDGVTSLLTENQSCFIPMGATHRLANPGKMAVHLIEVQSGCYFGEDDIVRFEDCYGRVA